MSFEKLKDLRHHLPDDVDVAVLATRLGSLLENHTPNETELENLILLQERLNECLDKAQQNNPTQFSQASQSQHSQPVQPIQLMQSTSEAVAAAIDSSIQEAVSSAISKAISTITTAAINALVTASTEVAISSMTDKSVGDTTQSAINAATQAIANLVVPSVDGNVVPSEPLAVTAPPSTPTTSVTPTESLSTAVSTTATQPAQPAQPDAPTPVAPTLHNQPFIVATASSDEEAHIPYSLPALPELAEYAKQLGEGYDPDSEEAWLLDGVYLSAKALAVRPRPHQRLLANVAAIQSRLHALVAPGSAAANCQWEMYQWLRDLTHQESIYLPVHMSKNSLATTEEAHHAYLALQKLDDTQLVEKKPAKSYEVADKKVISDEDLKPKGSTEEVSKVRDALNGGVILLIGSEYINQDFMKNSEAERLNVRWRTFKHGESPLNLETDIRQPDVAVAVALTRWVAHSVKSIKSICKIYDRPYVQLPAGYSINSLCYQIWQQVGEKLIAKSTSTTTTTETD